MSLHLIAVSHKLPSWIQQGFDDYNKRLPIPYKLNVLEHPLRKRTQQMDVQTAKMKESELVWKSVQIYENKILLDEQGALWRTVELAAQLRTWIQDFKHTAFVIGGPDGLDPTIKQKFNLIWSLSPLTFPHALARVLIVEQIYRAWSIIHTHPYHRE